MRGRHAAKLTAGGRASRRLKTQTSKFTLRTLRREYFVRYDHRLKKLPVIVPIFLPIKKTYEMFHVKSRRDIPLVRTIMRFILV